MTQTHDTTATPGRVGRMCETSAIAVTAALATTAMIGTVVLLPIYFIGADFAMIDRTFPPHAVSAELAAWYRWNWVRTGLTLGATSLSCVAGIRAPYSTDCGGTCA